jgi:hypothetical protein
VAEKREEVTENLILNSRNACPSSLRLDATSRARRIWADRQVGPNLKLFETLRRRIHARRGDFDF